MNREWKGNGLYGNECEYNGGVMLIVRFDEKYLRAGENVSGVGPII